MFSWDPRVVTNQKPKVLGARLTPRGVQPAHRRINGCGGLRESARLSDQEQFPGVFKIPGAVTIVVPGLLRLKEWAYAGIVFELSGAVASHEACGKWGTRSRR